MVSSNPLFRGGWTAKKFGATVIDDIWQEVTIFTLVATRTIHFNSYTPGLTDLQLLSLYRRRRRSILGFQTNF
jgi:hypothetical protein